MQTCSEEIINSKSRNFVATGIYRPPKEEWKAKEKCKHKTIFIVGDLNINSLDYDNNECFSIWFFNVDFCLLYGGLPE